MRRDGGRTGRVAPHVAPRLRRLAGEVQRPIRLAIIVIHPLVVPVRGVWLGLGVGVGLGLGLGLGLVVAARLVEHARDALHEDDARQHAAQGEAHAGEPQAGLGPLPASLGFEASAAYRQENMKT